MHSLSSLCCLSQFPIWLIMPLSNFLYAYLFKLSDLTNYAALKIFLYAYRFICPLCARLVYFWIIAVEKRQFIRGYGSQSRFLKEQLESTTLRSRVFWYRQLWNPSWGKGNIRPAWFIKLEDVIVIEAIIVFLYLFLLKGCNDGPSM